MAKENYTKLDSLYLTKKEKVKSLKAKCLRCDIEIVRNTYRRLCEDCREANNKEKYYLNGIIR